MHTNHRRKNKYKSDRHRWYTAMAPYKRYYWTRERAREAHLMAHGRYDDCQNQHPRTLLWEVL